MTLLILGFISLLFSGSDNQKRESFKGSLLWLRQCYLKLHVKF